METIVKKFLEENAGLPKLIILGEDHGGNGLRELRENVGKELSVVRTIHNLGQPFIIYSEMPTQFISKSYPNLTVTYLKQEAQRLHIPFQTSKIGLECRNQYGACDDLYETNITSYLNSSTGNELVVAVLGLLHVADMKFSEEIRVLRLNCTSFDKTMFAISELRKKRSSLTTAAFIENNLPYISDADALKIGEETVPESAIPKPKHSVPESSTSGSSTSGSSGSVSSKSGSFEPDWIKNEWGDWVARCPVCGNISGLQIQLLTHTYNCPNKGKTVDISKKPKSGGKRFTKRKLQKRKKVTKCKTRHRK